MKNDNPLLWCSVCNGEGKPFSGKPCICGGDGTIFAEMHGLRKYILELETEIDQLNRKIGDLT